MPMFEKSNSYKQFYAYLPKDAEAYLKHNKTEAPLLNQMFVSRGTMGVRNPINQEQDNPRFIQLFEEEEIAIEAAKKASMPNQCFSILRLKIPSDVLVAVAIKLNYPYIQTITSYGGGAKLKTHRIHAKEPANENSFEKRKLKK